MQFPLGFVVVDDEKWGRGGGGGGRSPHSGLLRGYIYIYGGVCIVYASLVMQICPYQFMIYIAPFS